MDVTQKKIKPNQWSGRVDFLETIVKEEPSRSRALIHSSTRTLARMPSYVQL